MGGTPHPEAEGGVWSLVGGLRPPRAQGWDASFWDSGRSCACACVHGCGREAGAG